MWYEKRNLVLKDIFNSKIMILLGGTSSANVYHVQGALNLVKVI